MIKNEDEASNYMHVGSARLLSRSPHNNNTLHGEQLLLLLMLIHRTPNVDKKTLMWVVEESNEPTCIIKTPFKSRFFAPQLP